MNAFHNHISDLTIWSRALAVSLKFKLANTEDVYNRLLKETGDMNVIMSTFFGSENADQFSNLLTRQIATYRHLIEALLANNSQEAGENLGELYQIADDMSTFFAKLNPRWSKELWQSLIRQYYLMLYYEAFAIVSDNYTGEIELFDNLIKQSYLIGEYISNVVISNLHLPTVKSL